MARYPLLSVLLAAAITIFTVGCSGPAPKLSVLDAQVTEQTDAGMVVTFTMMADNPSGEALPLRDVEYEVSLHGKPVFKGTRSAQATVRRFGTQDFTLPCAIPLSPDQPAPSGTVPYTIQGTITYLVPGALAEALFDMDVLRPTTSFEGRGVVDLSAKSQPAPRAATQ
jgi:hypothetical protein